MKTGRNRGNNLPQSGSRFLREIQNQVVILTISQSNLSLEQLLFPQHFRIPESKNELEIEVEIKV